MTNAATIVEDLSAPVCRQARPADIGGVTRLGLMALRENAYPGLHIAPEKVRGAAQECITGAGNFCWVSEYEGEVVAAVSAVVHDLTFYERKQASVIQFYSTHPGEGVKLLRIFLAWARKRPAIKAIAFTLESQADWRIGNLLKRLGLSVELPVYMEIK